MRTSSRFAFHLQDNRWPLIRSHRLATKSSKTAESPPAVARPGTAPGTLPYGGSFHTRSRNFRKKVARKEQKLLTLLQAQGVLKSDFTRPELRGFLSKNGFDLHTSPDLIRRRLQESQESDQPASARDMLDNPEQGTKEADGSDPIGQQPASQDSGPNEVAVRASPNESPAVTPKVRVMRKDKEAYQVAVRAGLARPGRIKQWLHDREAAYRTTLAVTAESSRPAQDQLALQPTNQTPKSNKPSSFPYSIRNKGWKQIRNKPASRTTFDADGNPIAVDDAPAVSPTTATDHQTAPQTPDAGPDAWRSKIFLSVVECEDDAAQLPAPDFPFKQLQHNPASAPMANGKKRKRKRNHRTATTAYHREPEPQLALQPTEQPAAQTAADATTDEDLPMLPADMSRLSALTLPLRLGTVIAFKYICLGRNYAPEVTSYRTARIEKIHTDLPHGPLLELRLATRDRPQVQYDEETGERVLGKFDMPGFGDGEEEGFLELSFSQLLEAKVVQLPEGGAETDMQQQREEVTTGEDNAGGHGNPDELDYGEDVYHNRASPVPPSATATAAQPNTRQTAHTEIEKASAVAGEPEQEKPDDRDGEHGQQQDTGLQAGQPETGTLGPAEQGQDDADQETHEPPPAPSPVAIPPHDSPHETVATGRQSPLEHRAEPVEPQPVMEACETPSPAKPNRALKNGFMSRERPSWNDLFGQSPSPPRPSAVKPAVTTTTPSPPVGSQKSVRSRRPPPQTSPATRAAAQRAVTRSNPRLDRYSDSDGDSPPEAWFLKTVQSAKRERGKARETRKLAASSSERETDSPELPPLPQFSPLAGRVLELKTESSIAKPGKTKRKTSTAAAKGGKTAKRNSSTTGGNSSVPSTPRNPEKVYVDLTLSSPASPRESSA